MTKNIRKYTMLVAALLSLLAVSCIEDDFAYSPSYQPAFSTDTLRIGDVYTDELTTTRRMTVYNPHAKGLNLQKVEVTGENAGMFRINVDGLSGNTFSNIEIRAKDSIFVFVEARLPENGTDAPRLVEASIDFTTNGVKSSVVVSANGQDVNRLRGAIIDRDTRFTAGKPYQVFDSLVVAPGATLTIEPGARVFFHDKAWMGVWGTLRCEGTAEQPIRLTGDRTGDVLPGVTFDLMSRQWECLDFYPSSNSNYIAHTEISNTSLGVTVYGDGSDLDQKKLTLVNSKLRNSGECVLLAFNASVEAYGCEFAEAGYGLVYLVGGDHRFDQCTVSNHYLFKAIESAAWIFVDPAKTEQYAEAAPTKALITNTITWGLGADCEPSDLTGSEVFFRRCLFKSQGEDDDNFTGCLWDSDPLFYTVREDYMFDYRLKPDSPAIGAAQPDLSDNPLSPTDFYGVERGLDLGAYVYTAPKE